MRNHAGSHHLFQVNGAERVQRVRRLLEPQPRGIDEPDDRGACLHGQLIEVYDFLRMHLAHGPVHHRRVLAVHIHGLAADHAITGDAAVRGSFVWFHIEIRGSRRDKPANLNETVVIE